MQKPMRFVVLISMMFHCAVMNVFSQQARIDSLIAVLKTQKQDTNRINTLVELCREFAGKDTEKALSYGEDGLMLADNLSFQRGLARAYVELGRVYGTKGDVKQAQEYLERGLKFAEEKKEAITIIRASLALTDLLRKQGKLEQALKQAEEGLGTAERARNKVGITTSLGNIGLIHSIQGRYKQALDYYHRSLKFDEELGNKFGIALSLNNIGVIHRDQGRFDQALEYFQRSLKMKEELGDKAGMASSLNNIGMVHRGQGRLDQALNYYQRSLKLREELGDKAGTSLLLNNIGIIHRNLGRLDQALDYYTRSLKLREDLGDKGGIATSLGNIGNIYASQERYELALDSYQRCLKLFEELGDKSGIATLLINIGIIHKNQSRFEQAMDFYQRSLKIREELGEKSGVAGVLVQIGALSVMVSKPDTAISYISRAYWMAKEIGAIDPLKVAAQALSDAYILKNDFAKAYEYHKEYTALKDSLVNESNIKSINEMTARYEAEKREQQIALLEKDKSLAAVELERRQEELLRKQLESDQQRRQLDLLGKEKEIQALTLASTNIELDKQRLENEQRIHEVDLLTKDKQLQASLLERETLTRNFSIGGLGVVLLLTVILYNRYRYKRRMTEQLTTTLSELQRTQTQLIHAEKMATLGELTAGIAHEIKNPLNFVTNFSDVSNDMIEDLEGASSEEERNEILASLKSTISKIKEHGRRADNIVKSMMLHARGTAGEMFPVDINALVEEAVGLAYHGMRATKESFNVTINKNYHPRELQAKVIPQEISRVLLNILNNAMYAATTPSAFQASPPSPGGDTEGVPGIIWITTAQHNHSVEIRILDNGPGIPDEIKDKIFQPFFTTKPTGHGTGLGLSMSYDIIVNGHNGTLSCNSNGEVAEFIVTIPLAV